MGVANNGRGTTLLGALGVFRLGFVDAAPSVIYLIEGMTRDT